MPDIMQMLNIDAPPERVFAALTTADAVRRWTHDTDLESEVGGAGRFGFHDRQTVATVRIEALTPATHVALAALEVAAHQRYRQLPVPRHRLHHNPAAARIHPFGGVRVQP